MADARPFRALRYDGARIDPALTIAPPYDVISPEEQHELYARSPYNVVRVEYGETRADDTDADNRYTRAAADLQSWRREGVLVHDDEPALYRYRQEFDWQGAVHVRNAYFATVRLEEWEKGVVKPHEHTLSTPKEDRLKLLRATRTQVSPVYSLYRAKSGERREPEWGFEGTLLADATVGDQRHVLSAITDPIECGIIMNYIADCDVYIADGHHRYETALNYRNEVRARSATWTGDEPENFVLMALTHAYDDGLLVLPTHRLLHVPAGDEQVKRIARHFAIEDVSALSLADAIAKLAGVSGRFLALGLRPGAQHVLTLEGRAGIDAAMPAEQPDAWKQLDVSVLQYGILGDAFGIDDAALAAGQAVTYTQDAEAAAAAVERGEATCAFLINATPVDQVLAVADAGGRMPQKSTYFYPKLPTGLVMRELTVHS
ncbi:MAG TPA: DUF1015 domain-containing protein [Dehalococcoidia bacterium]|nr:DUF1015 domain-containing protein [Dehalococcoidia bacterium]